MSSSVWCVVVAAGSGQRFGGPGPKQYEHLLDRRVLDWSLDAARAAADGVVLVVAPERIGDREAVDAVVAGGATRTASVSNGLAAVPPEAGIVVIHDAARPLASAALFRAVIGAVRAGAPAAIPATPVIDTIKRVAGGHVVATVAREDLVAVQTPQAFDADVLRRAHAGGLEATDDAALVEAMGEEVVVVPGEVANVKITTRADLAVAAARLGDGASGPC